MFQTGINHLLQSVASDFMIALMKLISLTGNQSFYLFAIIVLMFGIDYRKGFIITHVIVWTSAFTWLFKHWANYPRPFDIDLGLNDFGGDKNQLNLDFGQQLTQGIFGLIPENILEAARSSGINSKGFPSGHVSLVTSFFLSVNALFKRKELFMIAVTMIVLTAISRLFLGQHFLADVIGGFALGFFVFFIALKVIIHNSQQEKPSMLIMFIRRIRIRSALIFFYLILIPLVLVVIAVDFNFILTQLLGINIGYLIIGIQGHPRCDNKVKKIVLRVAIASTLLIFFIYLGSLLPFENLQIMSLATVIEYFLTWWLSSLICLKLGLLTREQVG